MRKSQNGFTLIELLVVIAIIAILAAILFPVFAKAKKQAKITACISNMKNICMAFQMYAQDYDDCWPCYLDYPAVPGHYAWVVRDNVQPYMKNTAILQCPMDVGQWDLGGTTYPPKGTSFFEWSGSSYQYYVGSVFHSPVYKEIPTSMWGNPAECVLFAGVWTWHGESSWDTHSKNAVGLGYMDGHAKVGNGDDWMRDYYGNTWIMS